MGGAEDQIYFSPSDYMLIFQFVIHSQREHPNNSALPVFKHAHFNVDFFYFLN